MDAATELSLPTSAVGAFSPQQTSPTRSGEELLDTPHCASRTWGCFCGGRRGSRASPGEGADASSLLYGHSCSTRVEPECVWERAKGARPQPGGASPAEGLRPTAGTTDVWDGSSLKHHRGHILGHNLKKKRLQDTNVGEGAGAPGRWLALHVSTQLFPLQGQLQGMWSFQGLESDLSALVLEDGLMRLTWI